MSNMVHIPVPNLSIYVIFRLRELTSNLINEIAMVHFVLELIYN